MAWSSSCVHIGTGVQGSDNDADILATILAVSRKLSFVSELGVFFTSFSNCKTVAS